MPNLPVFKPFPILKILVGLLFLLWLLPAQAEYQWQDTFRSQYWPTAAAACVQGEAEARVAQLRREDPSLRYWYESLVVNEYDGNSQCSFIIKHSGLPNALPVVVDHQRYGVPDPCPLDSGAIDDSGYCRPKNAGQACPAVGNPIHAGIANKYQPEDDYRGSLLRFQRHYNFLSTETGPLGANWRHTYLRSLQVTGISGGTASKVKLYRHDGKRYDFSLTAGHWQPDADVPMRLVQNVADGNTRTWQLTNAADEVETYDPEGHLIAITDRKGLTQTLTYSDETTPVTIAPKPGLLMAVKDADDRQINFTYDAQSRIATLQDPAGKTFAYGYDGANNLTSVTYPDTKTRTYHYNEVLYTGGANWPHALGKTVKFSVYISYDNISITLPSLM